MNENQLPWMPRKSDFVQPGLHSSQTNAYEMLFEFLRLSPTYELARISRTRGLTIEEQKKCPRDFNQVLSTYDLIGDVNHVLFRQWWLDTGLKVFGNPYSKPQLHEITLLKNGQETDITFIAEQVKNNLVQAREDEGLSAALIISIPLELKRSEILKIFKQQLDQHHKEDVQHVVQPRIKLLGQKFHTKAMLKGLRLLCMKAAKPNLENWRLGAISGISSSYSKVLDPKAPRKPKNSIEMDDRIILGKIVFRSIEKFETIVENAARGKFPSEEEVELTNFEYPKLVERLNSHTKWVKDLKAEWIRKSKSI
ncbi:MAG: hypothetical protein EB003_09525 [Flavobacteriia bacterium]|nr:hypothetical protein [Flavobacteriia bacterium]